MRKQTKDLKEWAIDCLRKPLTGCLQGEGRRTTLRIIKFSSRRPSRSSVKVEEYEVQEFDSKGP